MASEDVVQQLREQLDTINRYEKTELISRPEWGTTITFEVARQDIDLIQTISADLSSMPLVHLTDQIARNIMAQIPGVVSHLQQVDEFRVEEGNASENRDSIAASLQSAAAAFHEAAGLWLPYLAYRRGDVSASVRRTEEAIAGVQTKLQEASAYAERKRTEVDKIVDAAREASASAGVGTFTSEFASEADALASASSKWLCAVVALATLTVLSALGSFFWPALPEDAGSWATLRHVVAKLSVIAALFAGTIWCGRIYRALRHQRSINKHRSLSLKTFQAFVQATDDPMIRDAVLMAATRSIFANVPTGFVDDGMAGQDASVNVLEIGKSIGKSVPRRPASEG